MPDHDQTVIGKIDRHPEDLERRQANELFGDPHRQRQQQFGFSDNEWGGKEMRHDQSDSSFEAPFFQPFVDHTNPASGTGYQDVLHGHVFVQRKLVLVSFRIFFAYQTGHSVLKQFFRIQISGRLEYRLESEHDVEISVLEFADLSGFQYVRAGMPEYLRIVERGTLRTYGQYAAPLSAFCSALLCTLMYPLWWYLGKWFATIRYVKKI